MYMQIEEYVYMYIRTVKSLPNYFDYKKVLNSLLMKNRNYSVKNNFYIKITHTSYTVMNVDGNLKIMVWREIIITFV